MLERNGDGPAASPHCLAGCCPWVSLPCGSQPCTFMSTQFVTLVVCKWWERGAAFHLAASTGEGGLRAQWAAVAVTCAAKPGRAVTWRSGSHTPANALSQEWEILWEVEQSLENQDAKEEDRQKDGSFLMKVRSSLESLLGLNCSFLPSPF